jgi:dUTP pyrophosphatase
MSLDKDSRIKELEDRVSTLEYHLNIKKNEPVFPISLELDKIKGLNSMNQEVTVKFERTHPDAVIPEIAYQGDACFDLFAVEDTVIPPCVSTLEVIDTRAAQGVLAAGGVVVADMGNGRVVNVESIHGDISVLSYEEFLQAYPEIDQAVTLQTTTVKVGKAFVPVGLKMELPEGWEATFRTRSGMGVKKNMRVHPGTIDAGYRGDLAVAVYNMNNKPELIKKGTGAAQVAIRPVPKINIVEGTVDPNTQRGEKGFGSSDKV